MIAVLIILVFVIIGSIFGSTAFLPDIVAKPVTTILFFGKYVKELFVWLGNLIGVDLSAVGTVALVIIEIVIFIAVVKLFCMLVEAVKRIINIFRGFRK